MQSDPRLISPSNDQHESVPREPFKVSGGLFSSLDLCQPNQLCAHLPGFFQIQWELLLVMGLLVLGVEACHVELAVVLDLQRVKTAERLHLAVQAAEGVCLSGQLPLVLQLVVPYYKLGYNRV